MIELISVVVVQSIIPFPKKSFYLFSFNKIHTHLIKPTCVLSIRMWSPPVWKMFELSTNFLSTLAAWFILMCVCVWLSFGQIYWHSGGELAPSKSDCKMSPRRRREVKFMAMKNTKLSSLQIVPILRRNKCFTQNLRCFIVKCNQLVRIKFKQCMCYVSALVCV